MRLVVGAFLLTRSARVSQAAEVRLKSVTASACSVVKLFERCEVTVHLVGDITNPYDPEEIDLQATFHPPQGRAITVTGFYYEPIELALHDGREAWEPQGQPVWKIRFTPRQLGRWSFEVQLRTKRGTHVAQGTPFLVSPSSHRGFVRLDPSKGSFRFETGEPFVPIGENLAWGPSVQAVSIYQQWMNDLAKQRANYIRLWMAPWFLRLETKDTGVGRYDQTRARLLDELFERSRSAGLYVQLCLLHHGSFSQSQDPDWQNNPYNQQLGGMCRLPNDFVTHPRAKTMFRRLLRYMVSRWGDNPQLVSWELFNEPDLSDLRMEDFVPWLADMSAWLRAHDVNARAITTSFHGDAPPAAWALPTMDWIQLHLYDQRDFPSLFTGPKIKQLQQTFHKPILIGEFGWIADVMRKFDDIGIHLHDGLWSSVIGGSGGGALVWYWDTYVHPNHLERHFGPLEQFLRGESLGEHARPLEVAVSDPKLAGWARGDPARAYVWVKNRAHNLDQYIAYRCELAKQQVQHSRGQAVKRLTYEPSPVHGATLTVRGLTWLGRYRVEWWDTYRGRIASRAVSLSQGGRLTVGVPDVTFDVAAKLIRLHWWERVGGSP